MSRPATTARTVVGYGYPDKPYHTTNRIPKSCWTTLTEPSRVDSFASLASSLQCTAIMIHAARCAPLPCMHEHAIVCHALAMSTLMVPAGMGIVDITHIA